MTKFHFIGSSAALILLLSGLSHAQNMVVVPNATTPNTAFSEASKAFSDPKGLQIEDLRHSQFEIRLYWIGKATSGRIKITINIDRDSLDKLRNLASGSGASYQKLLNQILREGLKSRKDLASRVDRIERELERLKKKRVA